MLDRTQVVHQNFLDKVASGNLPSRQHDLSLDQAGLGTTDLIALFESQVLSRQLDRRAKIMQAVGEGFYTIASSGHEGMAAVAAAFRVDDMAFLHYRDAAFQIQRAKQLPEQTSGHSTARDMLLSFAAAADDPISGGRHKVLGSLPLFIPPQTSTIASHLPKAVGAAYSVGLARRLKPVEQKLADDAIILCSFGDASANHSTAQGAFNTASWTAYQQQALPLVFICEDNGIGISTKTPGGWIEAAFSNRPDLKYMHCDGLDLLDTYRVAKAAEAYTRKTRRPVFLHLRCVRLYGHAGPDTPTAYLSKEEIESTEQHDPLLYSARILLDEGLLDSEQILDLYNRTDQQLETIASEVRNKPKLQNAQEVMASLIPPVRPPREVAKVSEALRAKQFGRDYEELNKPQHMARLISWALTDLMLQHSEIVLAGEDIGPKGGVYNVTAKLHERFGAHRVINTLLDEQSILGLAIGMAHNGILPIVEIQFLAYLHNAEDQLRGEAATLSFFSKGQYTNPMIIRVAGLGYQKGFGGHFHNDNSLAVIRDIPGVVIACPSNGEDAVLMLRECVRLAVEEQRVVVFLEPIALYMARDLHQEKDVAWCSRYPRLSHDKTPATSIQLGEIKQHGSGTDLAILSYANGYYLSRKAEKILAEQHGLNVRVIDIRWLAPLAETAILEAIKGCKHVLVVDECRRTGSQSEAIVTLLSEQAEAEVKIKRVVAEDSFIPLGTAATVTLPSFESIAAAALQLVLP